MEPLSKSKLLNIVQGFQHTDPRLYAFMRELIKAVELIALDITTRDLIIAAAATTDPEVTGLEIEIHKRYIQLSWDPIPGRTFVVRQDDNIKFVTTNDIVLLDAVDFTAGSYTFSVALLDGEETAEVTVQLGTVGLVEVTDLQEFSNSLYMTWATPESDFEIDRYVIAVGTTVLAEIKSNSYLHLSNAGLMGLLSIKAIDIAGNEGPDTLQNINISEPNNFFHIAGLIDVDFDGDKVHGFKTDNGLLLPVDIVEGFETPDIPQETMQGAGDEFPYMCQPSADEDGTYTEEFDFEQIFEDVYLNTLITCLDVDPDHAHTLTRVIKYKDAASDSFTTLDETAGLFINSVRFVRVEITVAGTANLRAVCLLRSIRVSLSLAYVEDSGATVVTSGVWSTSDISCGLYYTTERGCHSEDESKLCSYSA